LSVEDLDIGMEYAKLNGPIGLTKSIATPIDDLSLEFDEIISE
jgi:hypothetical protein